MSSKISELDAYAVQYLGTSQPTNSKQLFDAIVSIFPSVTPDQFAELLARLLDRGQIDLFEGASQGLSLSKFLSSWERLLWFYGLLASFLAAVAVALDGLTNSPFIILRWALGLLFVLFLPGYALVEALFPSSDLSLFPHLALSIGLSLIVDMMLGFALNYTSWGIRLVPIIFGLSVITLGFAITALLRQFALLRRGRVRITRL